MDEDTIDRVVQRTTYAERSAHAAFRLSLSLGAPLAEAQRAYWDAYHAAMRNFVRRHPSPDGDEFWIGADDG